uniref:Uncharacterized protein n=1 Tax=Candidatus Kentrum eta TaxID=2126337 RepID=A0A450UUT4_9GAMM|nr:MAG: hypothetical protein BECKH772B_GA0070898_100067 [Candidatus Kentron sp. H]VFJ96318.1 MAG: hypothetical protein BECKH772A_GA0070896_101027 [Candidatus Kentron sp. H]VFK03683.1 MAG: hypothetical protein BECKH772C_GA0070978_101407 [Candidatus Kentron sp. H]
MAVMIHAAFLGAHIKDAPPGLAGRGVLSPIDFQKKISDKVPNLALKKQQLVYRYSRNLFLEDYSVTYPCLRSNSAITFCAATGITVPGPKIAEAPCLYK